MQPFTSSSPLFIAHRGGVDTGREPALADIQRMAKLKTPFLEIDVRASADGTVYVWHGSGHERLLKWRPLNPRRLGPGALPLEKLIRSLPQAFFFIDPKHEPVVQALAETIAKMGTTERVAINSFSRRRTLRCERRVYELTGKHVPIGMGVMDTFWLYIGSFMRIRGNRKRRFQYIFPPHRQTSARLIIRAHACDLKVYPWIVNDPATAKRLLSKGADGFISDTLTDLRSLG